jgi:hypothetical protein
VLIILCIEKLAESRIVFLSLLWKCWVFIRGQEWAEGRALEDIDMKLNIGMKLK